MRGRGEVSGAAHFATVSLYNNSTGAQVLVVRDLHVDSNGEPIGTGYVSGTIGTHTGLEASLLVGDAIKPGLVYTLDDTTLLSYDWGSTNGTAVDAWWPHDFPFAVIQPGWSLFVQCNNRGATPADYIVSFAWEAITSDELDFLY
jgi:hypothetical protein